MDSSEVSIEWDRHFIDWLCQEKVGLLVSSYKSSTLFCLGRADYPDADVPCKLALWLANFVRTTGLYYSNGVLWMGLQGQLMKLVDVGQMPSEGDGSPFDACLVPRLTYFISDLDIHDITLDDRGRPYFVATNCNSICRPTIDGNGDSFEVFWSPPWIGRLAFEDRCHLNGLCSRDGKPRYVTAVSRTDVIGGWREHRQKGGVVYDIIENRVVCEGLSMPHSPRWHSDRLWLLEAGTGHFGYVDGDRFVRKTFIPGFLRGLSFVGDRYAVICSSSDRHEQLFQGLPLGDRLKKEGMGAKCGIYVVDLMTFDISHNFHFTKGPIELYDIVVIPGVKRPFVMPLNDGRLMTLRTTGNAPPVTKGGRSTPIEQ